MGGDAGIGKTTLATAVAERARARGFVVLTGHLLDIDRGAALKPVREALRGAAVRRPDDDLPRVDRRIAEFLRGGSEGADLDDLGLAVAVLAAEAPLLLLLEDMHWADRSTQELAVSLAHTALGPLCLVLTYRADELTRRHPFRRALVEIGRSAGARRVDLTPLDREGIGSRLDLPLLATVSSLTDGELDACLRQAIDANVLRLVDEHVDFRHGLLREAVYDDLLPGERTRAHERLAEGLQHSLGEDPALAELGMLAFHRYAAHDLPAAYEASARAGLAARKYGGFAEAIGHLGRALELYDRVPHHDVTAPAKAELLRVLAESRFTRSEYDRAEQVLLEALDPARRHVGPAADVSRVLVLRDHVPGVRRVSRPPGGAREGGGRG